LVGSERANLLALVSLSRDAGHLAPNMPSGWLA
jgi:hypothetical protein